MEIIIAGEAKEIAALVLGVQERQTGKYGNISGISEYSPDSGTDRMYPGIVMVATSPEMELTGSPSLVTGDLPMLRTIEDTVQLILGIQFVTPPFGGDGSFPPVSYGRP